MRNFALLGLAALAIALGGCDDGGTDDMDAGPEPGVDSGTVDTDAGGGDDGGTPGTDGGTSGTDGGTSGTDSGTPGTDGGSSGCAPGTITIMETCPTFTACGGSLVGDWCYSSVCITKAELLEQALMAPGVPASCTVDEIDVRSSSGTIEGTISATASAITRDVTSSATGTFYLSENCKLFNSCRATEAALNAALDTAGSATCVDEPPGCECDVTFNSGVDSTDTYTTAGNTITFDGSGRTFDYCVDGTGNLVFRETGSEPVEPGTQTAVPMSAP